MRPSNDSQIKIRTTDPHNTLKHNRMGKQALIVNAKVRMDLRPTSMLSKLTDYTPGNAHDSNFFTSVLAGDEAAAFADKAYAGVKYLKWLKEHKVESERTETSH